jgi:hypothetical protein
VNLTELCHFVKFKYIGIEVLKVNKKEEVIKELGPIAKVLNIKIDYVIDSNCELKRNAEIC